MKKLFLAAAIASTFATQAMANIEPQPVGEIGIDPVIEPITERPISLDPVADMPIGLDPVVEQPITTPVEGELPLVEAPLEDPQDIDPSPVIDLPGWDGDNQEPQIPENPSDLEPEQPLENDMPIGATPVDPIKEIVDDNNRQDRDIAKNRADIDRNTADISELFSEVDRLDDRIDGTQASLHAVTNARPYLSGEGKTAIGVGLGHAGSVNAIAVGAAHAFTDQWSASATLNTTTGGDENDFSFGVGTQFEF